MRATIVCLEQSSVCGILKTVLGHLSSSEMLEQAEKIEELFLNFWSF